MYLGDEAIIEVGQFSLEGRPDPQGPPVGQPPAQGRLRGRAASRLRARRRPSPPRSRRCSSAAARAPPSAASRWRWTRCTATTARTRWSSSPAMNRSPPARPRRPALRPLLRAPGDVAVVHAPRPEHAQRPDRVPGGQRASSCCASGASMRCRSISPPSPGGSTAPSSPPSGRWASSSRSATRSSRSRACTASTPSSSRAGSPDIWSTRGRSDCRGRACAAMWAEGQIPKPELPRGSSSTGARCHGSGTLTSH